MAQESVIPQKLMTAALLHFEQGVPICDCDIRTEQRERLARVSHVYMVWKQNPLLDVFGLFKQMTKQGKYADVHSAWKAARQDKMLFDFVVENVAIGNRHEDEALVRAAAKQAIRVGMETDNTNALVKGGKLLYDVAGLDKPESEKLDMAKSNFLSPVVTIKASEVDDTKIDYDDEQSKKIMQEFGAYIDPKRQMVDDKVALIEAKNNEQTGDESEYE